MPKAFSRLQIRLHWIIFLLIVGQYIFHEPITMAWEKTIKGIETGFSPLVAAHVVGGVLIFVLVLWRIIVRIKRGAPALPKEDSKAIKIMAHAVHFGLYALMIFMPISGAAAWFGGVENAANAHSTMRVALLALVAVHVLGALYHQYVLKDGLMRRMWTPGKD